jgi:DNA mismatch repair ATPase MutS
MKLSPFLWCQSGLRLADKPGERSLFEREIMFSKQTLTLSKKKGYGLVLYDECFHSTNPPDGEKTAQIFLSHLWKSPTTISIVSSHVFSLVESATDTVEKLCVPAEQTPEGIHYTFTLTPGICKVSSVEEIYKKYRFPLAAVKE